MNTFLVTVVIFILAGLISSANRRSQPPARRARIPWLPPENLPERRLREPWQELDPWEQEQDWEKMQPPGSEDVDLNKDQELTEAEGKEGEWGDEGRPDLSSRNTLPRKYTSLKPTETSEPVLSPANEKLLTSGPLNEPGLDIMVTGNQLTQAVIWSEILGRPRAMRKYRPSRH